MDKRKVYMLIGSGVFVIVLGVTIFLVIEFNNGDNAQVIKAGPKIVIDHDGGSDDAMAIFLALLYEKYFNGPEIVALTTVHGNIDEPQVFENTQRILDIANRRDVPLYRGSNYSLVITHPSDYFFGQDGLGDLENVTYTPTAAQSGHAVNALIELSKKYEGELIVVGLAPVTNIALAIKLDPHFIGRLSQLYIAGGNVYDKEHNEPEFNALLDVEGYHIVAENSTPNKVTFIPFSPILVRHNISVDWRVNVLGSIETPIMNAQNQFDEKINAVHSTWNYLDPQAMAMVLNPDLVEEYRCTNNSIILCGDRRGINTNDFIDCSQSNIRLAYPVAHDYFKIFLYDTFSAELEYC